LRVLKSGGCMVHVVPAWYWKASSLAANPVGYPLRIAEKWRAQRLLLRQKESDSSLDGELPPRPGFLQVIGRWFCPPIHGTYPSHRAEYRAYLRSSWNRLFEHPRLAKVAEVPLLSYTQFGFLRFRLLRPRVWLAEHGFPSSLAFVLRKVI